MRRRGTQARKQTVITSEQPSVAHTMTGPVHQAVPNSWAESLWYSQPSRMYGIVAQAVTAAAANTGTDATRTERRLTIRKCSGRRVRPSTKKGRNCSTRWSSRSSPICGDTEPSAASTSDTASGCLTAFHSGVVIRHTNSAQRNHRW